MGRGFKGWWVGLVWVQGWVGRGQGWVGRGPRDWWVGDPGRAGYD